MSKKRRKKPSPGPQPEPTASTPDGGEPAGGGGTPAGGAGHGPAVAGAAAPEHKQGRGQPTHPSVRHESSAVRFRYALWTAAVALAVAASVLLGVWRLFNDLEDRVETMNVSEFPLAAGRGPGLPVQPRLEQIERVAGLRPNIPAAEQPPVESTSLPRDLERLQPTSEAGYVQIPIDRAIELVVPRLKVRPPPAAEGAAKDRGLVDGGESNSGRMLRGQAP